MKIFNKFKVIIKKIRSPYYKLNYGFIKYYEKEKVLRNTILYESRDGSSMTDSPYAIFEYLLKNDPEKKYQHYWSIKKSDELDIIIQGYGHLENVHFVERNSNAYLKLLTTSEYLINNSTFQSFFIKKKEQTYINTWHGTPLKYMGYDMKDTPFNSRNVARNFYIADFLLSPNKHTTDMFLDSYRMRNGYNGEILESGYPRIDATIYQNKNKVSETLLKFGVHINPNKKIILYAPTWKGKTLSNARNDLNQIVAEMDSLNEKYKEKYQIFVKVHPYLYQKAKEMESLEKYLIPDVIDTNEVLSIADILITDYSSIFFDFLVTDKPILFYCWDEDTYEDYRGNYFELSELPGKVAYTIEELSNDIENIEVIAGEYQAKYLEFKNRFVKYDDGKATKRYVDYIFNDIKSDVYSIVSKNEDKKKIILYPGGLKSNGITSSFLNVVNNIDLTKTDVSVILGTIKSKEQIANFLRIPKEAHIFFRFGNPAYKPMEIYRDRKLSQNGVDKNKKTKFPSDIYERDVFRLLGDTHFDTAIDFSGYSFYWGKFVSSINASKKIIYMHNDLKADAEKVINGKMPHHKNLYALFSIYYRFDKLVSVSEQNMEINRKNLIEFAPADKFDFTPNSINSDRILNFDVQSKEKSKEFKKKSLQNYVKIINGNRINVWNKNPFDNNSIKKIQIVSEVNQEVVAVQLITNGEEIYYKIVVDDIYIGWVSDLNVILGRRKNKFNETIENKTIIGKMNTKRGSNLYQEVPNFEQDVYIAGPAWYLRNLYVKVSKWGTNGTQKYAFIKIGKYNLGWINVNYIHISKHINRSKLLPKLLTPSVLYGYNKLKYHDKLLKVVRHPISTEKVELFAKNIKEDNVHLNKNPFFNLKINRLSTTEFITPGESVSVVRKRIDNKKNVLYFVRKQNGRYGWVQEQDIELYNNTSSHVWTSVSPYYALNRYETINVSSNIELKETMTMNLNKTKKNIKVFESSLFSNGTTVLKVEINGDIYFVNEDEVVVNDEMGVKNQKGRYISFPPENVPTFVTMGRLSPEKNHKDMILAFSQFFDKYHKGMLYILGQGVLEAELKNLIIELNMSENIIMVGQLEKPFKFLSRFDTFVLSSKYEGQPMVLLEAMTLGMPIISTDIPSCRFVLEDGKYGYLTLENTAQGIFDGMVNAVENKPQYEAFDYNSYNKEAMNSFYNKI
ncbi:CDP-glycerol glycerophosphotransferase family protein [Dellaglioa sp. L3N]